jgi:hypothetical protein
MQWFGTAAIPGADPSTTFDERAGNVDVERERRSVQTGVTFIDLR